MKQQFASEYELQKYRGVSNRKRLARQKAQDQAFMSKKLTAKMKKAAKEEKAAKALAKTEIDYEDVLPQLAVIFGTPSGVKNDNHAAASAAPVVATAEVDEDEEEEEFELVDDFRVDAAAEFDAELIVVC